MFFRKQLRRLDAFERFLLLDDLGLSRFGPFLFCAAPVATVRGTPGGIKLKDGYSTKITVASNATIEFWEKMVTPVGYDAGNKIPQSTMHNTRYRTYAMPSLIDVTESTIKVAYDPLWHTSVLNVLGKLETITETFPDGSTLAYFGSIKSFVPDAHEEGKQPEATIVIVALNVDSSGAEQAPVLVNVAGT